MRRENGALQALPLPHFLCSPSLLPEVCLLPKGEVGGLGHDGLLGGLLVALFILVSAPSLYPSLCSHGIRTPTLDLEV